MFGSVSGTPTRPLFKTINIVKVCLTRQLHSRRAGKKWEAMAKKISQPEFGIVSFWRPRCLPDQLRKRMVLRPPQSLHSGLSFSQEAKHRRAQTYKRTRRHRPTRARTLPQKHTSELALARAAALSTSPAPARPPPRASGSPPPPHSFTLPAQAEIPRRPPTMRTCVMRMGVGAHLQPVKHSVEGRLPDHAAA